ncbi:PliI family lysozyme inhibitor of I-type lysozyme [Oceanisphaera sp. W20_SRM_FM3]|uniref:PliI family lysozyme inhibitor of I-type lysozyme n=1 Tax=Oceanisphaera sp. W20_SRM_FM3 TaxID=3240267 RepID=UPI003F9A0E77
MMRYNVLVIALLVGSVLPAHAADDMRFVTKTSLPNGQTLVVAEGDFEARSIGSVSVRLYETADEPNETTFFMDGLILPREGVLEKVLLADITGDQQPEIIVLARSVGTGNFLSATAIAVTDKQLVLSAAVTGLNADADPVIALQDAHQNRP